MSISLITNFRLNTNNPIDTRLVATDSSALTNMEYKYEGLTVYRTDSKLSYTWNGMEWEVASNGIYGGSGSLLGDTFIDQSYIGDSIGNTSYKFILSGSSSAEKFHVSDAFTRNSSTQIHYRRTLLFDNTEGPYISLNPQYSNDNQKGGFSIGTGDNLLNTVSERFRIEGDGIIKFKPSTTLSSLNISENGSSINLGYNWSPGRQTTGIGSSYFGFDQSSIIIGHLPTTETTSTHSVVFEHPSTGYSVTVNGNFKATNNIYFGDTDTFQTVANNGLGLGINKLSEEVSLFNDGTTKFLKALPKSLEFGAVGYNVSVTASSTFSVYGGFYSGYKTKIWDNAFNVDRIGLTDDTITDNYWYRDSSLSNSLNDTDPNTGIMVILDSGSFSQDAEFLFTTNGYIDKNTKSTWVNSAKSYDRMFYFYNTPSTYHISHRINWYLSNDSQTTWKKIGNNETGNQDNFNQESGATGSYANRLYSNSVLVPADMDFKVQFVFPNSFTPDFSMATSSLPSVRFAVMRSGRWRTSSSSESIV